MDLRLVPHFTHRTICLRQQRVERPSNQLPTCSLQVFRRTFQSQPGKGACTNLCLCSIQCHDKSDRPTVTANRFERVAQSARHVTCEAVGSAAAPPVVFDSSASSPPALSSRFLATSCFPTGSPFVPSAAPLTGREQGVPACSTWPVGDLLSGARPEVVPSLSSFLLSFSLSFLFIYQCSSHILPPSTPVA